MKEEYRHLWIIQQTVLPYEIKFENHVKDKSSFFIKPNIVFFKQKYILFFETYFLRFLRI